MVFITTFYWRLASKASMFSNDVRWLVPPLWRHTPPLPVMHVVGLIRSLLKIFVYAAKQACALNTRASHLMWFHFHFQPNLFHTSDENRRGHICNVIIEYSMEYLRRTIANCKKRPRIRARLSSCFHIHIHIHFHIRSRAKKYLCEEQSGKFFYHCLETIKGYGNIQTFFKKFRSP